MKRNLFTISIIASTLILGGCSSNGTSSTSFNNVPLGYEKIELTKHINSVIKTRVLLKVKLKR